MVIVIISREFIISGFRLMASDNGVVIAASYWGKFKTTFQMVMICLMTANIEALSGSDHDCNVGGAGADSGISGRLSDEKQRRAERPALIRIKILLCRNVAFAEYFYEF